jgi:gamma-glutamyl hercynylcysteine S-oxide synthase
MTVAVVTSETLRRRLEAVRERTLALVAPLDWTALRKQHVAILSPMVWDLGHIGNFEELWLSRALGGAPLEPKYDRMFDAIANPRPTREALPLPDRAGLFDYLGRVREGALGVLAEPLAAAPAAGWGDGDPLTAGGFVWEMVAEHEEQHQETLLQAMQAMSEPLYVPGVRRRPPPAGAVPEGMIEIPAGSFTMGSDRPGFAYDNERQAHEVDLPAFAIDSAPVTNRAYLAFIEEGGYREPAHWSEAGWRWREGTGAEGPLYCRRGDDGRWRQRRFDREREPAPDEPVIHVCYWEAEAYARWRGARLPSEAEWEKAALWEPAAGRARLYPWGDEPTTPERANLDQLAFGPAPVGAYPAGASAYGVQQMVGDVWEWTSSDFLAYPGFAAFPYAEYSQVFFGPDFKVLRGGSWATRPAVARGTFRNWDYPIRRQIFSGFRCARDL